MKRITALFLTLAALLTTACGGGKLTAAPETEETVSLTETAAGEQKDTRQVPVPMKDAPDYSFDHEPTVDEMRQTAIRAMHDIVSVQWFPEVTIRYNKKGSVSNKDFEVLANKYYMGVPYTSAGTGLFQFLAYYDKETGCLHYTDQASFNEVIGTSCAGAVGWGLLSVCSSITGENVSNFLTISNGYLPLGDVTYDPAITDFSAYYTKQIVQDNGTDKVLAGYAAVQPGDVLVYGDDSEGRGHTRMAIAAANVVKKADGSIDPDQSTITTQEQAAEDIVDESAGVPMIRCGQVSKSYTFTQFLQQGYIAVTTAEFLGQKPYEKCQVTFEGDSSTLEGLAAGTLHCNYPMAVMRVILRTDKGEEVLKTQLFNRRMIGDGTARDYQVLGTGTNFTKDRRIPKTGSYSVALEVTASTGEVFTPAVTVVE